LPQRIYETKNKGKRVMSRLIITILSAGILTLVSAGHVQAQDDDRLAKFVPTELWACNYNEGHGYFTDEQDFDVLWLGAWTDGNAMGKGRDNYHATGGAIMAEFGKVLDCNGHLGFVSRAYKLPPDNDAGPQGVGVMTFTNCSIKEGATYDTVVAGLSAWAKLLSDNGSKSGMYQWWPTSRGQWRVMARENGTCWRSIRLRRVARLRRKAKTRCQA
jgi:hypothetical protein